MLGLKLIQDSTQPWRCDNIGSVAMIFKQNITQYVCKLLYVLQENPLMQVFHRVGVYCDGIFAGSVAYHFICRLSEWDFRARFTAEINKKKCMHIFVTLSWDLVIYCLPNFLDNFYFIVYSPVVEYTIRKVTLRV